MTTTNETAPKMPFLKAVKEISKVQVSEKQKQEIREGLVANGHSAHIGAFTVREFDGTLLKAGCHVIEFSECQAIAEQVLAAAGTETEAA